MLTNARVVLVRPHYPGNLGSVARAMCNFGLNQLTLVDPFADPKSEEARRLATHGEHLLESAVIVPSLDEAVADCRCGSRNLRQRRGRLSNAQLRSAGRSCSRPLSKHSMTGPVQLVFGPEPSGLANAEIAVVMGSFAS